MLSRCGNDLNLKWFLKINSSCMFVCVCVSVCVRYIHILCHWCFLMNMDWGLWVCLWTNCSNWAKNMLTENKTFCLENKISVLMHLYVISISLKSLILNCQIISFFTCMPKFKVIYKEHIVSLSKLSLGLWFLFNFWKAVSKVETAFANFSPGHHIRESQEFFWQELLLR